MLRKLLLSCLVLFGLGTVVTAQEPQTAKPTVPDRAVRPERPLRKSHLRPRRERRELGRRLNLTDEQRKLSQAIRQKYSAATKPQREKLFQLREKRLSGTFTDEDRALARAVRQEMMTAMRGLREESLGVLTPEQRSQLDSLREQRRTRREEMRQRREERRLMKPPLD